MQQLSQQTLSSHSKLSEKTGSFVPLGSKHMHPCLEFTQHLSKVQKTNFHPIMNMNIDHSAIISLKFTKKNQGQWVEA